MSGSGDGVPTVSVVIPVHDRAHLVSRAVRSVLAQSFRDLELLVVDDGSSDGTADIVAACDDPRVRLVRRQPAGGVGSARNEGVRHARGGLVAFLDSDDEWLPGKLERQVAALRVDPARERLVVSCRFVRDDHRGRLRAVSGRRSPAADPFEGVLRGQAPLPSAALVPHPLFDAVGGLDEALPAFADYEFWLRLAAAATEFVEVDAVLVIKHEHGDARISRDPDAMLLGFRGLDVKWRAVIQQRQGHVAYRRWRAELLASIEYVRVWKALERHGRRDAWRHWLQTCRHVPWSFRYAVYGLALAMLGREGYAAVASGMDRAFRRRRGP